MKNVYGYIRVSTAKQGQGVSLIVQKEAIERYALQNNLNIIQWFEEKETAAKQGRLLFTNMMKLLNTKKADGVIIHKIDRSARNWRDWLDINDLTDAGYEIHFAHESLDMRTRGGRLSADIQVAVAVDYIRNLRQEAIKGLYGRLKQGIYPFQAPTGYLDTGKGNYKALDPVQGPFVRKAFELYGTGNYTLRSLLLHMRELGMKGRKEKMLKLNGISSILNNPFYIGILKVKGTVYPGGHKQLISTSLFEKVQAILRRKTNQKVVKHDFQFKKLIRCKTCGYSLIGEIQKGYVYYRCHTKECPTKAIREIVIQNEISLYLRNAQLLPRESALLEQLLNEVKNGWVEKHLQLLQAIKMQSRNIQERLDRLTDCYLEGGLDKQTYQQRKEKLLIEGIKKEETEKALLLEKEAIFYNAQKFLELAKNLTNSYKMASPAQKCKLVKIMTSNLSVEGKKLTISMRSPFLELINRQPVSYCAPDRDTPQKINSEFVNSDDSTIIKPASKKALRDILDLVLKAIKESGMEPNFENLN